jgi:hypothetical protein
MTKDLNDSLDALFAGDTGPVRTARPLRGDAVPYKTAEERFEEGCPKCNGRGRFISYAGRDCGECFACKGAGKRVFKSSAADRAKSREQAEKRKADRIVADLRTFELANPAVWAWLKAETAKPQPFAFAVAMVEAIVKFGDLTERQLETCERLAAKSAERVTQRAARAADAPAVDTAGIDRLKAAFDQAVAYSAEKGLKLSPRITIGGLTISPAKATSTNPGALYVKQSGGEREYLGKVANGRFFAVCTPEQAAKVASFIADPAEAAKVYGQTTGTCCICNATLKSEWKHRGIGPICAEKFGWA